MCCVWQCTNVSCSISICLLDVMLPKFPDHWGERRVSSGLRGNGLESTCPWGSGCAAASFHKLWAHPATWTLPACRGENLHCQQTLGNFLLVLLTPVLLLHPQVDGFLHWFSHHLVLAGGQGWHRWLSWLHRDPWDISWGWTGIPKPCEHGLSFNANNDWHQKQGFLNLT